MPTQNRQPLPSIKRFIAGLITNRNPIDTPFSVLGLNLIEHYDALIDGLNMEVSNNNTLQRRPGFATFATGFAAPVQEVFNYKDLLGNLSLFYQVGGDLYQGTTKVSGSVSGGVWSLAPAGNFLYAANGQTALRITNTALTTSVPMGLGGLQQPPKVAINTNATPYFLSTFIPTGNAISGILSVSDSNGYRVMSVTIGSTAVHFNVTYTGNQITQNSNYTQVTNETVVGSVTTDVITSTSGYTGTATGTGISNGVVAYYPNEGVSSIDFDMAYTGTLTMTALVNLINSATPTITAASIPASATTPLTVFITAEVVTGIVASTLYPDTAATAIAISWNGN